LASFVFLPLFRSFNTAIRLEHQHHLAMAGLALLYYSAGKFVISERVYRRALGASKGADDETRAEIMHGLGASIEMQHTRLDQAIQLFERCLPKPYTLEH
jgi:Tfp pilus assembly protein PilF